MFTTITSLACMEIGPMLFLLCDCHVLLRICYVLAMFCNAFVCFARLCYTAYTFAVFCYVFAIGYYIFAMFRYILLCSDLQMQNRRRRRSGKICRPKLCRKPALDLFEATEPAYSLLLLGNNLGGCSKTCCSLGELESVNLTGRTPRKQSETNKQKQLFFSCFFLGFSLYFPAFVSWKNIRSSRSPRTPPSTTITFFGCLVPMTLNK